MECFFLGDLVPLPLAVLHDLILQLLLIGDIILLFQELVVNGYNVLLLFLPPKLLSFKVSYVFDFVALFLKPLVRLIINLLQILNILLSLNFCMVINLKRSLRSHKIRIGIIVIGTRDLFSTESEAYEFVH
jgi:hypothetical protein